MEKKNKNQISTVLLIVGVIFIMIAGSIFVTTAWQHLSEMGKRMILTCACAGLYAASWKLREKGILVKTEHALYYLAAAGTGFITVSFLGGWDTVNGYIDYAGVSDIFNNADRAMWGLFAAGIGIAYRFFRERKAWDFGILSTIFVLMFLLVFDANIDNIAGVIPLILFTLLATFQYKETERVGYRIAQSFGLVVVNHFCINELYNMFYAGMEGADAGKWWFYASVVVDLILMALTERRELICSALTVNWFSVAVQIFAGFDTWDKEDCHLYNLVPFAVTTALTFTVMWYRSREEEYKKLAVIHGLMAALEIILFAVAKTEWFHDLSWDVLLFAAMSMSIMSAFVFEMIDAMLENDIAKRIMKTCSLVFLEFASFFLVVTLDLDDFSVEAACIFFGAGIVLLGNIWYDRAKGVRVAQFVLTCVTLFVLLLHNIEVEELANLMFLGIVGIVMLVIAAMKNRKEYVIASSTTLSLLALYLTREFWLSIEWWIYLFAAGVILVGIAIKKEKEAK